MVLSFAIVCDHNRRIADDRRIVFPYDRRRSDLFAIYDPRSSAIIWKPGLSVCLREMSAYRRCPLAEI